MREDSERRNIAARFSGDNLRYTVRVIFFLAASVMISVSLTASLPANKKILGMHGLLGLLSVFKQSLSGNRLLTATLAVMAWLLLRRTDAVRPQKRCLVLSVIFAAFFSLMQLFGISYSKKNSWDALFATPILWIRFWVLFIGMTCFVTCLLILLSHHMDTRLPICKDEDNIFSWKTIRRKAGIFFVCWMPYFIYCFPATGNGDTPCQILQFFGRKTWYLEWSAVQADDIFITNHHPVFMTFVYGCFAKLGDNIGHTDYGIALFIVVQMIFLAFLISFVLEYLACRGLRHKWCVAATAFVALFPLFPLYAVCMVKDVLYSAFFLWLVIALWETARTSGEALLHKSWSLSLFLSSGFLMLSRNNGVHFIAVLCVVCLICYRKYWRRVLLSLLLPLLLFRILWIGFLLPKWNIAPGGRQEAIGFMFQQTARYVKEHPEDVSAEEEEVIRTMIDYDRLGELYNPNLQDPVKYTFRQQATSEELHRYYLAWFRMFFRHPGSYIQASLNIGYHCYYLSAGSALAYKRWANRIVEEGDELFINNLFGSETIEDRLTQMLAFFQGIPLLNLLFNMSSYTWLSVLVVYELIRKKRFSFLIVMCPTILTNLMMLLAPVCNFRYVMPTFFVFLPMMGMLTLETVRADRSKQEGTSGVPTQLL